MSLRRPAGFIRPGYDPLEVPNAPTIGTLSNAGETSLSIAFTVPTNAGGSVITGYVATVKKTSDGTTVVATGSSSPISIAGLTTGSAYTCTVTAVNSYGPSASSATSNSATPALIQGQEEYTAAGTYSWVAPAGVTSVCVVAVGGGGGGGNNGGGGGGGGGLMYANNVSVTPGASYTVVVGAAGVGPPSPTAGGNSTFNVSYIANGGSPSAESTGGNGGGFSGGTGGATGGKGGNGSAGWGAGGGGGAAGYTGNGGAGGNGGDSSSSATNGASGSGGGGGGGGGTQTTGWAGGGAGGGVGILGSGSSGSGGALGTTDSATRGGGGSSGTGGGINSTGGAYGGGGGGDGGGSGVGGPGAAGAVRIIWGPNRAFPSTNTGNL